MTNTAAGPGPIVNTGALEPLFAPWEAPSAHRVRAERAGDPAKRVTGRRPSQIAVVDNLRRELSEWRDNFYPGASDTTRALLNHWFERAKRLSDADVREHLRAVFVPLIRARITEVRERLPESGPEALARWRPYQVTHSERHPVLPANRTLFNLVPCNRQLEVAMTQFLERGADVQAFAKNDGPQALLIDFLAPGSR